jgi:nucleoside-diphosphate kinase
MLTTKRFITCICLAFLALANIAFAEQTLAIIKPDAVEGHHIGDIISRYEKSPLQIKAIKMVQLSPERAKEFYAVHKDKPFYNDLVNFMSSGPIVAIVLEGDNAILKNRELIGTTDPTQATAGTIRKDFAQSKQKNAVHGSDSPEAAKVEIAFFFQPSDIVN